MLTPGGTLGGRYRLDERIATGGMGDVWKAEDTVLGRTVAVKILQSALLEEPGFIERFRGEARVMATIDHPGVVRVYDYGETSISGGGTVAFLVMEFVEGEALSRTLSRVGRLTPSRTMSLIAQAADALQAAHDKGIVHRDVKPGNLLVRPDGKLVLTDFGIARTAAGSQLTQAGSILGTASYVSPEQASGATVSASSDVYSLGVVAYQCVAGRRPFEGDNPVAVAMSHIREQPPPLPADVTGPIRGVIDRAMAKDPAQRWPSAAAFAGAARQAAQGAQVTGALPTSGAGAGTAVMPAYAPVSPRPTSGSPTGSYARGAAGVPSSAPPADSTYGGGGYGGGYPTQTGQPPAKKRSGLLIAGIVLAALLVLGGGTAIGIALLSGNGNGHAGNATSPTSTGTTKTTPKATTATTIDLKDLLGKQYSEASQTLTNAGVHVTRANRVRRGTSPGEVWGYKSDNEQVKSGDYVVLYVEPGEEDDGDGNGNGNGNGNNNGGVPVPTFPSGSGKASPSTSSSPQPSASNSAKTQDNANVGIPR